MKKKWIVTAVSHGPTSDGKARVLAVLDSKDEAKAWIRSDIEEWADKYAEEGVEVDFEKMRAHFDYDPDDRCEWNYEEVDVKC